MSESRRLVLDRLSGSALLCWPTFWLVLALSFVMTGLTSTPVFSAAPMGTVMSILLGQVALFAVLWIGAQLWRHRTPVLRRTLVIPVILVAAASRGIVVALVLSTVHAQAPQWLLRVGGSMLGNSLALVLVALVVDSLNQHRQLLADFAARNAELQRTRERVHREITQRHAEVVERVRRQLLDALDRMEGRSAVDVRDAMRRTAEEVVRPLSHDLAEQTAVLEPTPLGLPRPRIDWAAVTSDATSGRPLPAFTLALTLTAIGAPWSLTAFTAGAAASVLLTGFIAIWLLTLGANEVLNAISTRLRPWSRGLVMTALLIVVGAVIGTGALLTLEPARSAATVAASDVILIPTLGWLFAMTRAAQNQRTRLEATMREINDALNWEVARAGETQWQQRRALSRALHGPVQSAIGGAAVRLDLALQAGEPAEDLIEDLQRQVVEAIDLLGAQQPLVTFDEAVDQLVGLYQDACHITRRTSAKAAKRLAADPTCATASADVVTEAVWNAVRHGRARNIHIQVQSVNATALSVTVSDDGTPPDVGTPSRSGLGTQLLDEVTLTWSRTSEPSGTTLTAVLPTA